MNDALTGCGLVPGFHSVCFDGSNVDGGRENGIVCRGDDDYTY